MSFGLKNAESTYQWMITWMSRLQISKTVEVYIDDMVVKSKKVEHMLNFNRGVWDIEAPQIMPQGG